MCKFDNCTKQPAFNLPTETKALYCFEHKKEDMNSPSGLTKVRQVNLLKIIASLLASL